MKRQTYRWITRDGEALRPNEMASGHLFNAIKMMWNNIMPPALRVAPFKRWPDVKFWPADYIAESLEKLTTELKRRWDYPDYKTELDDILLNAEYFLQLQEYTRRDAINTARMRRVLRTPYWPYLVDENDS